MLTLLARDPYLFWSWLRNAKGMYRSHVHETRKLSDESTTLDATFCFTALEMSRPPSTSDEGPINKTTVRVAHSKFESFEIISVHGLVCAQSPLFRVRRCCDQSGLFNSRPDA